MTEDVENIIIIVDCKDMSSSNSSLGQLKDILPVFQVYYPEYSHKLVIININFLVKTLYAAIKSFLNERTINKVSIRNLI